MNRRSFAVVIIILLAGRLFLLATPSCHAQVPAPTPQEQARVLAKQGRIADQAKDYAKAIDLFTRALVLDPDNVAYVLRLASEYQAAERFEEGQQLLTDKLKTFRTPKDVQSLQGALSEIQSAWGDSLSGKNNPSEAIPHYEAALAIDHAQGGRFYAIDLRDLGDAYNSLSQYAKAMDYYQQALPIFHTVRDRAGESGALNSLGNACLYLSQYAKAIGYYRQALPIFRTADDKDNEAVVQNNMGEAYRRLSQYLKAIDCYRQALALHLASKNQAGEAGTLTNLGIAYDSLNHYAEAIDYYHQSLPLFRALGDKGGEASTLNGLGVGEMHLSQYAQAIDYYQQALPLFRAVGDQGHVASVLNNLGISYYHLGQFTRAIDYYTQALPLYRALGNRDNEAVSLTNLGAVYTGLSQYAQAIDCYTQALPIFRAAGDREGEAGTLDNLGAAYSYLSQYARSIDYYMQSLSLCRAIRDREGEANALHNLGFAYKNLSQYAKAIVFYTQALTLFRAVRDRDGEAHALNSLGYVYDSLRQYAKAIDYDQQALTILRAVGDQDGAGGALRDLGECYRSMGQYPKAVNCYTQALPILRAVGDRFYEADTLGHLMDAWQAQNKPRLAIFYGKQAVNTYQGIRADIQTLDKASQKSFLRANQNTYRTLADVLLTQGRLPEAQQVLDLLKGDEYFNYIQRDATEAAGGKAALNAQEADADTHYRQIADQITTLGQQRGELLALASRTPEQTKRLNMLDADLAIANQHFQGLLTQLQTEFSAAPAKARLDTLSDAESLQSTLGDLNQAVPGANAVALYTLEGDTEYRVLLVTADAQKAEEYAIPKADLDKKILAFREALQNPAVDPRPLGQELYKVLFCGGALERDLQGAKAHTLMWSLDGSLRYLPVAALSPDGHHYLNETYCCTEFSPISLDKLEAPVKPQWTAAGLGVTLPYTVGTGADAAHFPALPGAEEELQAILGTAAQPGVLKGTFALNKDFTEDAFVDALRQHSPVVHIASHFQFVPGNDANSYLLLGDGTTLTMAAMRALPGGFTGIDLMTLSACNTAMSGTAPDGSEVEGFGTLVQKKGAKAVLASLWPVADESTELLMQDFYRVRQAGAGLTKAEALRQAQLTLLHGTSAASAGKTKRAALATEPPPDSGGQPLFAPNPKAPFAHPYYWAPFILIGNWK